MLELGASASLLGCPGVGLSEAENSMATGFACPNQIQRARPHHAGCPGVLRSGTCRRPEGLAGWHQRGLDFLCGIFFFFFPSSCPCKSHNWDQCMSSNSKKIRLVLEETETMISTLTPISNEINHLLCKPEREWPPPSVCVSQYCTLGHDHDHRHLFTNYHHEASSFPLVALNADDATASDQI